MPSVGPVLTTLKLRVAGITDWASQVPRRNPLYILHIHPWDVWFEDTVEPWKTQGLRITTLLLQFKTVSNFWLPETYLLIGRTTRDHSSPLHAICWRDKLLTRRWLASRCMFGSTCKAWADRSSNRRRLQNYYNSAACPRVNLCNYDLILPLYPCLRFSQLGMYSL